ncbi:MAG TPA: hypothetical protein VMB80_13965 [Candidatus Acidoferrum sp.]|nr:hypothetical protein [Candidatus Acidoferrum sp.]
MHNTVDPKTVDQIASFVEACSELQREPFYGKDESLSFRGSGDRWTFSFGDRFHFRSALISFRRLWMRTEPSNWEQIVKILKNPDLPREIILSTEYHERNIHAAISRDRHLLNFNMPGERIVDLWLNTVFAHGGLEGKNKRSDFEATVDQYGHAAFEFCFRSLVREVGREFLNLNNLAAKPALEFYAQKLNLYPSFRIGAAFGAKRKERTKEGHLIIREGSSEFFSEEIFEERFNRILLRYENKEIKFVFEHLDARTNELLRATLKGGSLADLLAALDGRLETKSLTLGEFKPVQGMRASWAIDQSRIDVFEDCVVVTDEKGIEALNKKLNKFREQLLTD